MLRWVVHSDDKVDTTEDVRTDQRDDGDDSVRIDLLIGTRDKLMSALQNTTNNISTRAY